MERPEPTPRAPANWPMRRAADLHEAGRRTRARAGVDDRCAGRQDLRGRAATSDARGSLPAAAPRGRVLMPAVLVFARLTVQEASRRRLLLALLVLTLLAVGFSAWGFNKITTVTRGDGTVLPAQQVTLIASQLLIVVTFMYSGVLALSAAVVAGPLISSEVESGLLLSELARPVRRSEVVIGKWLGWRCW